MGTLDSFIDLFFRGYKRRACEALYQLLKTQQDPEIEEAAKKVEAFHELTQLTDAMHLNDFSMEFRFVPEENLYRISFSVKGFEEIQTECTFMPPQKIHEHVKTVEQYRLENTAESLLRLHNAKICQNSADAALHKDCRNWNQLIAQLQYEVQIKATTTAVDNKESSFTKETLQAALSDITTLSKHIPEEVEDLWESIPNPVEPEVNINQIVQHESTSRIPTSSFHLIESTEAHLRAVSQEQTSSPSQESIVIDELDDTDETEEEITVEALEERAKIKATEKIQKQYKAYKFRRNLKQQAAKNKQETDKFIKMVHSDKEGPKSVYLVDPQNILPPVKKVEPESTATESKVQGTTKKVVANNGEYLTLAPTGESSEKRDDFADKRNTRVRNQWLEISEALGGNEGMQWGCSFVPGLLGVADENRIHLASGGIDVFEYIADKSDRKYLPLNAYKQACYDLTALHKSKIYIRDIKNENFLIKATRKTKTGELKSIPKKQLVVKFIDIDDALSPNYGDASNPSYTSELITDNLLQHRICGEHAALKSCDYYAMLISIFQAVHETNRAPQLVPVSKDTTIPYSTGLLNDAPSSTKEMFIEFLENNIEPMHQETVINFMTAPLKNPIPEDIEFFDLFKWS